MVAKTLTDYQHARQRTEMYLGSRETHTQAVLVFDGSSVSIQEQTWTPSLYTAFRELLDNALDEMVAHGYGDTLRVSYDPDTFEISIADNGRGIPIHEIPAVGKGPAASYMMSNPRSGRNFDERGTVAGVNGLGAAIVNFTSEWFELEIWRDGKHFRQQWSEGTYRKADIHKTEPATITTGPKSKTGTKVTFKPSANVWKHMVLPLDFITSRMWDIAIANPKLNVWFNGKQLLVRDTHRDPVISTMFVDPKPTLIVTKTDNVESKFYVVAGHTPDEHIHSLVNNIPVFQGGPHIDEFRTLFYAGLIKHLDAIVKKELGVKGKSDMILTRADVAQGLLIYNITVMNDPHFDSQSKTRLISEIKGDIRRGFFTSDVVGFIKKNPAWVAAVVDRCRSRTQNANNRLLIKEQKKLAKTKVASLKDATGKDRSKCILLIAEGESAIAGAISARDATIHGGLPLRGKIMNVHGITPKKVLASRALTDIMSAIGLTIGEPANPLHLRYGSIYISTDEDEDGKHITALIINFLFKFWPELFRGDAIIYKMSTPLIILVKGATRKYIYADEYDAFDASEWKGWQIIRAKGLARLTQVDWKYALNTPKIMPLFDDGELQNTLDLIFDSENADARKEWLSS